MWRYIKYGLKLNLYKDFNGFEKEIINKQIKIIIINSAQIKKNRKCDTVYEKNFVVCKNIQRNSIKNKTKKSKWLLIQLRYNIRKNVNIVFYIEIYLKNMHWLKYKTFYKNL